MDEIEEGEYLLIAAVGVSLLLQAARLINLRNRRRRRRWKTRPLYQDRRVTGFYRATFLKMKADDEEQFFKYTRMSVPVFNYFVSLLKDGLGSTRKLPDAICPEEKIAMSLNYLSQGCSMQNIAWSYKMGITTVQQSIHQVCSLVWDNLAPIYLPEPSVEDWKSSASDFYKLWNFPNCIGALDGKHIHIQAPAHSGSLFFNYKKRFSIILMALCDAQYILKLVDIGAYGSQSDSGVFRNSVFGQRLEEGSLNVPEDCHLPNTETSMPHVIVADEAFPLKRFIMRPYPGRNLTIEQKVFNYRLSRARRVIENTFGIMTARWRILKNDIIANVENVDNMIKAVVVLHNFCKMENKNRELYCPPGYVDSGDEENGQWRKDINGETLQSVGRLSSNNASRMCFQLRQTLCNFFFSPIGAIPWQVQRAMEKA